MSYRLDPGYSEMETICETRLRYDMPCKDCVYYGNECKRRNFRDGSKQKEIQHERKSGGKL